MVVKHALKVTIHGKLMWPEEGKTGLNWYKFSKDANGNLEYIAMQSGLDGKPDGSHPALIVQIDHAELQRLVRTLNRSEPASSKPHEVSHIRAELLDGLQKLDETKGT